MMIFGAVNDVSLDLREVGWQENIGSEMGEQGIKIGVGGGLEGWEGAWGTVTRGY